MVGNIDELGPKLGGASASFICPSQAVLHRSTWEYENVEKSKD